jgi:hypothetical protein
MGGRNRFDPHQNARGSPQMKIGQISVVQFPAELDAAGNLDCFTAKGWKPHQFHPAQAFQARRRDGKKIALSPRDISFDAFFKRRRQNRSPTAGIDFDKGLLIFLPTKKIQAVLPWAIIPGDIGT